MAIFLSKVYIYLPEREKQRLQKLLRIIFSQTADRAAVQKQIQGSYAALGSVMALLKSRKLETSFQRLLQSFCILQSAQINSEEREELQKNPYTIWPNENCCLLSAEAIELLQEQPHLKGENWLFMAIGRLRAAECRAWSHWLNLKEELPSLKEQKMHLYLELSRLRCMEKSEERNILSAQLKELPATLEEAFPDNPHRCPMAWFYRSILPLYHCLREVENNRAEMEKNPSKFYLLQLFKTGRVIAKPGPSIIGEKIDWLIKPTWEKRESAIQENLPDALFSQLTNPKEGLLF